MKRSEIIEKTFNTLETNPKYKGIKANSLEGVSAVLEVLENLGMLPPGYSGGTIIPKYIHAWEPEDE